MNSTMKPQAGAKTSAHTVISRDGKALTARYKNEKQARLAAEVIAKNREALLYLSKR